MGQRRKDPSVAKGKLSIYVSFYRARFCLGVRTRSKDFITPVPCFPREFLESERFASKFWVHSRGCSRCAVEVGGPKGRKGIVFAILAQTSVLHYAVGG